MSSPFDSDIVPLTLDLPEQNDSFLARGEDWLGNACLNWSREKETLYAIGHKQAANNLVKDIVKTGMGQDILIFPILFLYRHYLELMLKSIIREAKILFDDQSGFPTIHNLSNLWNDCHPLLTRLSPNSSVNELKEVRRLLAELTELDPNAMAFRYPEDKIGCPHLSGRKPSI